MAFFRLIGEYGGRDSEAAVGNLAKPLRRCFDVLKRRKYSKDIDEMRLVLCIGGELRDFDLPGGVGHHRIFKKDRFAYAEIVLHPAEWRKGRRYIKAFLIKNYRKAIEELCMRMEKRKLDIQTERLLIDVEQVLETFRQA